MYKRGRENQAEFNMQIHSAAMSNCSKSNLLFVLLDFFSLLLHYLLSPVVGEGGRSIRIYTSAVTMATRGEKVS